MTSLSNSRDENNKVKPQRFYVSLTRHLIGYYLVFHAVSELAVRQELMREYYCVESDCWKLPWCAVYSQKEINKLVQTKRIPKPKVIVAESTTLYEE